MERWLELGNRYARESNWKDFALVKFCLCAMGIIIGVQIPQKYRKLAVGIASVLFIATYIPLMIKLFRIALPECEKC